MKDRGLIIKIRPLEDRDLTIHKKDSDGNLPEVLSYRTLFGETRTRLTPLKESRIKTHNGYNYSVYLYKQYKIGQNYP